jgi:glycosyltransferase involved in cell wall biosynthesis
MFFHHENILNSVGAKMYQTISRHLFSLSINKTIISPSKWLLDLHHQYGLFNQDQSFVVNNPQVKKVHLNSLKEKSLVFVGQIEYHKGVDLFIKAAAFFPDYEFKLIGEGSLLEKIRQEKVDNLKILGWQDSEKISEIINKSAAIIVPSRCYENSPTVIYEAYAAGTPAIAADLGGIPELIEKFGGLLFKPDDLESLKEVIAKLIRDGAPLKNTESEINYTEKIIEKIS